ncbi:GLPGLI family protein [Chryseobacterium sp. A321]
MKKSLFLGLLFIASVISAQTHRFIYDLKFKLDSTSTELISTQMVLDINPDSVKFYEHDFLEMDSINKANQNNGYQVWGYQNIVTRKRNSFENKNYENTNNVFVYTTSDPIQWTLKEETKKVGSYTLQKATTDFGGRSWIAWFAQEIPYSEGPYKFRGLPGLVFEIHDTQNSFAFSMVEYLTLKKTFDTSGIIENYGGGKPIEISERILTQKKLEYYEDPLKDFRLQFDEEPNTKFFYRGTQITAKDQLKKHEKDAQQNIRRENNPIELDKAIHYPKK